MQTYEFYAKPENGVIVIPESYRNVISTLIKVILVDDKKTKNNLEEKCIVNKSDLLLPPSLDTKEWKFNREEANER